MSKEPSAAGHYYASSVFGWNVAATAAEARATRLRLDAHSRNVDGFEFWIYRVPLPIEAGYRIKWYKPDVDGAELVEHFRA